MWELRTRDPSPVDKKPWDNDIPNKLARLGDEGWELVAITPRSSVLGDPFAGFTSEELWVFKRPRE